MPWHRDSGTNTPRHRETETTKPRHCDSEALFQRKKGHGIEIPRLENLNTEIQRQKFCGILTVMPPDNFYFRYLTGNIVITISSKCHAQICKSYMHDHFCFCHLIGKNHEVPYTNLLISIHTYEHVKNFKFKTIMSYKVMTIK